MSRNPLSSGLGVSSRGGCPSCDSLRESQVAIPSVRVSVFRPEWDLSEEEILKVEDASQSPQFGSRCFVMGGMSGRRALNISCRNPLSSGLGVSSSPAKPSPARLRGRARLRVAIPSVRVSVFRLRKISLEAFTGAPRRNPLSSGLGVSSCFGVRLRSLAFLRRVAIPSVRVSVFRRGGPWDS